MPPSPASDLEAAYKCDNIDVHTFSKLRDAYSSVLPSKLTDLDRERLDTTPKTLAERHAKSDAYLTHGEVKKLVEWKLSHGTFRPSLQKLVSSNPSETVIETTRQAFKRLADGLDDATVLSPTPKERLPTAVSEALTTLTSLKGIGPATASLLLSAFAPTQIPFFSDELYRWLCYDDAEEKGKGSGWGRKIGYTVKEYNVLFHKAQDLRRRFKDTSRDVSVVDIELVAYYLGKGGESPDAEETPKLSVDDSARARPTNQQSEKSGEVHKATAAVKNRDADMPGSVSRNKHVNRETSTERNSGERRSKRLRSS